MRTRSHAEIQQKGEWTWPCDGWCPCLGPIYRSPRPIRYVIAPDGTPPSHSPILSAAASQVSSQASTRCRRLRANSSLMSFVQFARRVPRGDISAAIYRSPRPRQYGMAPKEPLISQRPIFSVALFLGIGDCLSLDTRRDDKCRHSDGCILDTQDSTNGDYEVCGERPQGPFVGMLNVECRLELEGYQQLLCWCPEYKQHRCTLSGPARQSNQKGQRASRWRGWPEIL
jgi:hypothetical protein